MRRALCPTCRAPVPPEVNPHRPFCSERCRFVDLEGWASERFRIAGEPVPEHTSDEDDGD